MSSSFVTPLRYPGGKGRLGHWLGTLLRHNRLSGGWYVEPYAGGAGAAVFLLTRGLVNHIVINDADPAVYAFWHSILHDTERFLQLLDDTPINVETWEAQRGIHAAPAEHDMTEVGFATFFLNRTNRSGILAGGVIGGKDQTGNYKIDARFNKGQLRDRISLLASMRRHISIYGVDAMDLVRGIEADLPERSLVYFDPPYYEKGSQLYRNFYDHDDHKGICEVIGTIDTPWLVTYDNCQQIRDLYDGYDSIEFGLTYSTHLSRPKATEIMFYQNLALPSPPELRR
ncbi:DNA adenine methylase [Cupriavidus plantarum]|uniref:DNA adenine methylase n=1 Tax=Cupriavidus plantarum TaxID=942865 RepID=UPI000EAFDC87|nr:DNA adenine methylase [Cupriavidus plantarum]RLK45978.1 site-specific DNA-adenine methylase [Cupriavidus plantarum]